MLPDYFYDVNLISTSFRLVLAVLLGGVIGIERGVNGHPAGFRTHILVSVGATLAMLTNQYVYEFITHISDPTRLGAQVITGVGFLGVGTILVTGRHKIKGLTTAAGLWASACMGLAIGIGFYSGAIVAALLILICLALLPKLEMFVFNRSRTLELYVELHSLANIKPFLAFVKENDIFLYETHLSRLEPITTKGVGLHISIKIPKSLRSDSAIDLLSEQDGVYLIEEF